MATTYSIVNECVSLVDGSASNDTIVINRWTRAVQRTVDYVWNDRSWAFRLKTDGAFSYNPAGDVSLPSDFGTMLTRGTGVYTTGTKYRLKPIDIGEAEWRRSGTSEAAATISQYTRWALGNQILILVPQVLVTTTLKLIYERRLPTCVYEASPSADELSWIPTRWHGLIADGARFLNTIDVNSNQQDIEKGLLRVGLDRMRIMERIEGLPAPSVAPLGQ